nr:immunoglobulin light chain junction region [Macaca mulatta]MOW10000.1 immunoglobulin light chain junction region [Macaca mulatta]MOW10886.1 immunoglobulin light chain junction region [Macaca mulatta]MOW11247.1 immunoglobulin light chain junction region [Macaca mulatta]MOW13343.1 immunoglobulin light chain junction region [Macaca mulatta]
CVQYSISPFTF